MDIPGPEKTTPLGEPSLALDRAVGKISAVWIWTVLFAASTAGTMSLFSSWSSVSMSMMTQGMRGAGGLGPGTPVLIGAFAPAMALMSLGALGYSWRCQLRYFRGYLIPVVLLGRPLDDGGDREKRAMRDLSKAYLLLILSVLCRLLPDALLGLLPMLSL